MELRPLGFGEIFDRAVTLYIRNLVPFATIVVVFVLPISILQYLLDLGSQPEFSAIVQILRHPARAQTQHIPTIFESPGLIAIFIAILFLTYLLWPFALNAVAVGVAALYRNRPVSVSGVLRDRAPPVAADRGADPIRPRRGAGLVRRHRAARRGGRCRSHIAWEGLGWRRRYGSGLGLSAQSSFLSSRFRCSRHYTLRSPFPCTRW